MIAFLTLLYCGVLFLLVRLGVIKPTLGWKLSPLAWMLFLLIVLFIPMQWGAPSGAATLYRTVVEVVPNVSGEVTRVTGEPLVPLEEGDVLFEIDPRPYQYELERLEAERDKAVADENLARFELRSNEEAAKTRAVSLSDVQMWRARLAAATAKIESLEAQIRNAKYDLEQTTVRAPSKGYVIGVTLLPGQRVTSLPTRSWMAFVDESRGILAAGVPQHAIRFVEPGQPAEVVFKVRPGRTYAARVKRVARMEPQGQLQPSGLVPAAPTTPVPTPAQGVVLELDGGDEVLRQLPGGAIGMAAIYTDHVRATHVIRKVMLRMQTWLNYVIP